MPLIHLAHPCQRMHLVVEYSIVTSVKTATIGHIDLFVEIQDLYFVLAVENETK